MSDRKTSIEIFTRCTELGRVIQKIEDPQLKQQLNDALRNLAKLVLESVET